MNKGMIFDIAHGSFVDGPGVRTTVFFKGCNLKCRWCHNPESQSPIPQMMFYKNKCSGCGICKDACPNHSEACDLCGICTKYCSTSARKLCGRMWTVDEVMAEIEKDMPFYESSCGGVTFSGGECMLQADFLKSLLENCCNRGIHTAVDTAGNVPFEAFEQIMPFTDTILYDVKCYTEGLHIEGTGVSNKRILENLQTLSKRFDGDIIIRIPIIPGYNTNESELMKLAEYLKSINCKSIELLPYHRMGESKYSALEMETDIFSVPSAEEMENIEKLFKK